MIHDWADEAAEKFAWTDGTGSVFVFGHWIDSTSAGDVLVGEVRAEIASALRAAYERGRGSVYAAIEADADEQDRISREKYDDAPYSSGEHWETAKALRLTAARLRARGVVR